MTVTNENSISMKKGVNYINDIFDMKIMKYLQLYENVFLMIRLCLCIETMKYWNLPESSKILQCTFGNMPLSSKCTVHFR